MSGVIMTSSVYSSFPCSRSHWARQRQSHINSATSRDQSGSQILTVISFFSMPALSARMRATKKTLLSRGHVFGSSGANEVTRIRYSAGSRCGAPHVIPDGFQGSSCDRRPRAVYQTHTKHLVLRGACVGAFAPLVASYAAKLQACNVLYIGNFNSRLLECSVTSDDMRRV
jgi:hypothetical protein